MASANGIGETISGLVSGLFFIGLIGWWWWIFAWWPFSVFGDLERVVVSCSKMHVKGGCMRNKIVKEGVVVFKAIPERQVLVMQNVPDGLPTTVENCSIRNQDNWNCPSAGIQMKDGNVRSLVDGMGYWSTTRYRLCVAMEIMCPAVETWSQEK